MTPSQILLFGVLTATFAAALASVLAFFLSRQARQADYNEEKSRAQLESLRESFENRLYKITADLTATNARWQDANHLIVAGQRADIKSERSQRETPHLEFLKEVGLESDDFRVDSKMVFVLIPFHPDFEDLYQTIQSACQSIGLVCLRGDEQYVSRDVLSHILKLIVRARIIIAVVEGRNPNVFYELGIAHALSKPVLTLSHSSSPIDTIPIDVRNNRIVFYGDLMDVKEKLTPELAKILIVS